MKKIKRVMLFMMGIALIILSVSYMSKEYLYAIATVPTGSMEDTLPANSIVFGSRISYIRKEPQRGDVIIFDSPFSDEYWVKRIIGLPGDTVKIVDGKIYIKQKGEPENDVPLKENYINAEWTNANDGYECTVPSKSYFVLGDNRDNSDDSRLWQVHNGAINANADISYVHEKDIVAKVLFMYYPKFKRIDEVSY